MTSAPCFAHRTRHTLLRDRVRALALQLEAEPDPMWFESAAAEPRSLGPLVRSEFERRGLRGADRKLRDLVVPLARWAFGRDPSTWVAAAFAVETALDLFAQKSLRGDDAAMSYRNGMSAPRCSTAYRRADLARLRLLPSELAATTSAVVQATWSPDFETPGHLYDPVLPPLEAIAVAALHVGSSDVAAAGNVREVRVVRDVVAIGLGLSAGSQALSAMLPETTVYSDATPYHSASVRPRQWTALVLNVPRASAYEVAAQLGAGGSDTEVSVRVFGELRARARRNLDARVDHVPVLVARLAEHVRADVAVVVLSDPEVHPVVEAALSEIGLRRRELRVGERRVPAVYVGSGVQCDRSRRRSRGLPAPTARVVTAWEVRP